MKKAQGISMTTLIIAVICLLVLVVIIIIFTQNINKWGADVKNCKAKGGECDSSCEDNEVEIPNTECAQLCCLKIFEK